MKTHKYYSALNNATLALSFYRIELATGKVEWRPQYSNEWMPSDMSGLFFDQWCDDEFDMFQRCTKQQANRVVKWIY